MEHEKLSRKSKSERIGKCYAKKITLYSFKRKYKTGDSITIETDSKEYLNKAKKEYAKRRKNKKIKKKSSQNTDSN